MVPSKLFVNRIWNFYLIFLKCLLAPKRLLVLRFICLNWLLLVDAHYSKSSLNISGLSKLRKHCWTRGCIQTVNLIRRNINETENPCNNFYEFACGGFLQKTRIPKYKSSYSRLTYIKQKVKREIKNVLKENVYPEEPRVNVFVKNYYKACTDKQKIESYGLQPILNIIDDLGGWPVVVGDTWDERNFDWMETDAKLRHHGFNPKYILNIFVFNNLKNTTNNILYINPIIPHVTTATMRKGFRSPIILAYYEFMTNVAALLGADKDQAAAELKQSVLFEIELTKAIHNKTATSFQNITTIKDLKTNFPFILWSWYLNELAKPVFYLKDCQTVKVMNPYYIANLDWLLKTTPKRVIANYMIWRAIAEAAPYLNQQIFEIYYKFESKLMNLDEPLPTWKMCLDQLTGRTGLTVGVSSLYINKYFRNETKAAIKPLLNLIVEEFQNLLKKSSWMDEESKHAALRKSEFMKYVIAYPNELLNDQIIDDYSKDLKITPDNHFKNRLNLNRFHFNYGLTGLKESTNKRLWVILSDSTVINAYYYAVNNAFALLAGILQPPIFNPHWPAYAKFASIGFVIGHEMMHAYDRTNLQINEVGSAKPLLSPTGRQEFTKRSKCFIHQYNKFVDKELGMAVDGNKTFNENLADNLGLKIAYLAYQTWKKSHKEELKPPFLNYTTDQMFWILSVNILCSKATETERINLLLTEVHTPDDFRTFGIVSNSPKFAEAFNCSANSRMNPKKKCELW